MKNNRGRPLGFKLSPESKKAISDSKRGQRHSEETKEKISRTLMLYFRNVHPLSKEFSEDYKELLEDDETVREWFDRIKDELDSALSNEAILTEKALNSKRLREISIEYNIDVSDNLYVSSFVNNPEDMCELKRACQERGLSFKTISVMLDARYNLPVLDKNGNETGEDNGE